MVYLDQENQYKREKYKALASKINHFFDQSINYAIYPINEVKYKLVRLSKRFEYSNNAMHRHYEDSIEFDLLIKGNRLRPAIGILKRKTFKDEYLKIDSHIDKIRFNIGYNEINRLEKLFGLEGKAFMVKHIIRERDLKFRNEYKAKYDSIKSCEGCNVDYTSKYSIPATDFLELHHIIPLYLRAKDHNTIIRENDVVLLCPNCHSAIHKLMLENEEKVLYIEEFRKRIN
jgi:predicted HNH restriction endonuclease